MTEHEARRILHLQEVCSEADIRLAYADLVRVWKADNFDSDPRLRTKAEAAIREIDVAYEVLLSRAISPQDRTNPRQSTDTHAVRPAVAPGGGDALYTTVTTVAGIVTVAALALFFLVGSNSGGRRGLSDALLPEGPPPTTAVGIAAPGTLAPKGASIVPSPRGTRPVSGTEMLASPLTGHSEIAIMNSSPVDAVMVLSLDGVQQRAVYVRTGESATVSNVAPGSYAILVTLGVGWMGDQFAGRAEYREFDRPVDLAERELGSSTEHTRLSLTLYPLPESTPGTHPISRFRLGELLPPTPSAPDSRPPGDDSDPTPVDRQELRRTGKGSPSVVPAAARGTP